MFNEFESASLDSSKVVESYSPNVWRSTVGAVVPRLAAHLRDAWETRET